MNNTFAAPDFARTGAGQAGSDSPMVRPIRPVKVVPAGYSLRSPGPAAGLVSRSRSLLIVPPVSLDERRNGNRHGSSRCPPAPDGARQGSSLGAGAFQHDLDAAVLCPAIRRVVRRDRMRVAEPFGRDDVRVDALRLEIRDDVVGPA